MMRRVQSRESRIDCGGQRAERGDRWAVAGHRFGLTLLEVLVSTAIFLGALTAIVSVMRVGHNARLRVVLNSEAVLRCESVMGELISGIRPLVSSGQQPFEDDPDWVWSAMVGDQGGEALFTVDVTVEHRVNNGQTNSIGKLIRYLRDPELFLEAAGGAQ